MEIIATSGGINWCWYHWGRLENGTFHEIRADRFHKFADDRGAGQHPTATHIIERFSFSPLGENWPEKYRNEQARRFTEIRAEHGWDESVTDYARLTDLTTRESVMVIWRLA